MIQKILIIKLPITINIMSKFVNDIIIYITQVIIGFESGFYKMIKQNHPDRLKLLSDKHHPFITIFRDLHENYYTSTFNSIVLCNDKNIVKKFNQFQQLIKHSKQCILNILANLIISIHFNLDRKKLDHTEYESYMKTLEDEIKNTISIVDIPKLFEHDCIDLQDKDLKVLSPGEKFITITMSHQSNGVNKEIKSFTMEEINDNYP